MLISSTNLNFNLNLNLVLILLSIPRPSIAAFKNDFSDYPSGTQTCLDNASDNSDCAGDTSAEMNLCLCSNGGDFVTNSAKCIAQKDSSDLASTWVYTSNTPTSRYLADSLVQEIMDLHCSDSNTPLTISQAQFMAYQSSVSSSSSASSTASATSTSSAAQQTVTTTASPTPDPDDDGDDGNTALSTGAKIGIIAGAAAAGVALLAVALFILMRRRKRRQHQYQEVHPMLAANGPPPGGPQPGDSSAHPSHMSMGPSELESAAASTMGSPNIRNTWQSSDGSAPPWSPGAFESVKAAQVQSLHQPPPREDVYEMPADHAAPTSPLSSVAEMPAIEVTSPTVSPTSRYSGVDWVSEQSEPRRYEPFRPR